MLRVAFMVFIRTRFFINDDDGIDDDADNNNADDAVCDCIFSLYLIVFVVHYISSFPVAELLAMKIEIGVILLQIRHYEPNLQPYQQTYFSQHYRSNVYKCKELIVTINRSSTPLSSS